MGATDNKELLKLLEDPNIPRDTKLMLVSTDTLTGAIDHNADIRMINAIMKVLDDPNALSREGVTPLHAAASKGNSEAIKILLSDEYIDPNALIRYGFAPLHHAVASGNSEAIKTLLSDQRTNPKVLSRDGATPLNTAISTNNQEAIDMLLKSQNVNISGVRKVINKTPPLTSLYPDKHRRVQRREKNNFKRSPWK